MMRITPAGGRGIGRMGIFLMRFLLGSLFLLSAGMSLSSCAGNHYPRPESWPKPLAAAEETPCDGITGIYLDQGASSCEWFLPGFKSLSYILEPCLFYDFVPVRHLGKADRVEITKTGRNRIAVAVYDAQGNLLFPDTGEDLEGKCVGDGVLLSYRPRIDPREGIELVSGTVLLSRAADGSLVCRVTEHRLFCSFIIPMPLLSKSYTVWYRFESREKKALPGGPGSFFLPGNPPAWREPGVKSDRQHCFFNDGKRKDEPAS